MIKYLKRILWSAVFFGAAILSACQPQVNVPQNLQSTPTISKGITVAPLPTTLPILQETPHMNQVPIPTPFDAAVTQMVEQTKADLAKKLGIDPGQIELVEASSVTWPDSSLGCPQPGMAYAQIMVDGILIRLRAENQVYEYHGGGSRAPFLCTK